MAIVYDKGFIKEPIYFQIYTLGPYQQPEPGDCWEGNCLCGAVYWGSAVVVRNKMNTHIQKAAHEPGTAYTIPGRENWLRIKEAKHGSQRAHRRVGQGS